MVDAAVGGGPTGGARGRPAGLRARPRRGPEDPPLARVRQTNVGRRHPIAMPAQGSPARVGAAARATGSEREFGRTFRNDPAASLVLRRDAPGVWVVPRPVPVLWGISGRGPTDS